MINVIIVDDHALFRLGLKASLSGDSYPDIAVTGEADSGKSLFALLKIVPADIVLLDIILPDMSGVEIARCLRTDYPEIKILAISAENTASVVEALMDIGINGFISKRQAVATELVTAIRMVMDGSEYFGTDISSIMYKVYNAKNKSVTASAEFTERELEIIALCHEGLLSKQIADRLFISPRTVDTHKNNIFKKLGINSTMEMVRYALKNGIIELN
jgi:DNA-binding NarL/FixJ family response regulator